ncbi:MAG: ABC transporter substrate-binding protein [Thaumarchaeota archaeon]|nr:ABC transporter substrate-binding protein [Nitrososphaerota archaeon]
MSAKKDVETGPGTSSSRRHFLKYLVAAGVAIAVAGVGGSYYALDYLPSTQIQTLTLGVNESGPDGLVYSAATSQNIFTKNRLSPSVLTFPNLGALNTAFAADKFNFVWNGNLNAIANARAKGTNIEMIYGNLIAANTIIVRNDSPVQTIYDLKGKTVGVPVLPSLSFIVGAYQWNTNNQSRQLDPLTDFKYSNAPSPELQKSLFSGQVDAIEAFSPYDTIALSSGGRAILSATDAWKSVTGGAIFGTVIGAQQDYANSHARESKELIQSWQDAVNYVTKNPNFVSNYLKSSYGLTDTNVISTVVNRWNQLLAPPAWDSSTMANLQKFFQLMQQYNVINSVPSGLLSNAFNP